jgi:hypothetical protein
LKRHSGNILRVKGSGKVDFVMMNLIARVVRSAA